MFRGSQRVGWKLFVDDGVEAQHLPKWPICRHKPHVIENYFRSNYVAP